MATPVIMPRQGQSVESCIIGKWNKKVGDKVAVGDLLFTYETDKATFDEEAKVDGTMLAIFFNEDDDVPCLTNVCVIGSEGEDFNSYNPAGLSVTKEAVQMNGHSSDVHADNENPTPAQQTNTRNNETVYTILAETQDSSGDIKISQRAKILADKYGADIRYAKATGPNGRIIERDIRTLVENGDLATSAAKDDYFSGTGKVEGTGFGGRVTTSDVENSKDKNDEYEEVKNTNIRKIIARTMHYSLSTMAQLTLNSSFDATEILSFREKLKVKQENNSGEKITINDIILYATAKTLLFHKECNAHYYDDKMIYFKNVNLGIAIDTPRGLIVPTLFNANLKPLSQISREVKLIVEECQKGTISPDALKGGTFTVTNLGTLGIESFTPVINPPQTCILGVNTIETKVKEVNGQPVCYKSMTLSITFDHRALDGATAARFLKNLIKNLEEFKQ